MFIYFARSFTPSIDNEDVEVARKEEANAEGIAGAGQ
jgi:hypothetical protein